MSEITPSFETSEDREIARRVAKDLDRKESRRLGMALAAGVTLGALLFMGLRVDPISWSNAFYYPALGLIALAALSRAIARRVLRNALPLADRELLIDTDIERVVAFSLPSPAARYLFTASHILIMLAFCVWAALLAALVSIPFGS